MRLRQVLALLFLIGGFPSIRSYGQVVATWTDRSGNWSKAANWSTCPPAPCPVVPNNGGGTSYNVVINGSGSDVITFDASGTLINTLTIGAGETFQDNGLAPTLTLVGPTVAAPPFTPVIANQGTFNWGTGANLVIDKSAADQFIIGTDTSTMNFMNSSLMFRDGQATHTGYLNNIVLNFNRGALNVQGNLFNDTDRLTLENGTIATVDGSFDGVRESVAVDHSTLAVGGDFIMRNGFLGMNAGTLDVRGNSPAHNSELRLLGGSSERIQGNFTWEEGGAVVDASSLAAGGNLFAGVNSRFTVQNGGSLSVGGNFTNWNGASSVSLVIDRGSLATIAGNFDNTIATVNVTGGVLTVGGNFGVQPVSGPQWRTQVSLQSAGALVVGGVFTNSSFGSSLQLLGAGNVATLHSVENYGSISVDSGSAITVNGGSLNNYTGGTFALGGVANVTGGFNNAGGSVLVSPTATLITSTYSQSAGLTDVSGKLVATSYMQSGGTTTIETGGKITATTFQATGGTLTVNGVLDPTAVEFGSGATLQGTGTIIGNVAMGGTIMPGSVSAPGTLFINGNYEQTGTGMLTELLGPSSCGLLNISGNAALDSGALLQITLLSGFNPLGHSCDILDYHSLVGMFANASTFSADGFNWDLGYGSKGITLTAVSAVPEPNTVLLLTAGLLGLCCWGTKNSRSRTIKRL